VAASARLCSIRESVHACNEADNDRGFAWRRRRRSLSVRRWLGCAGQGHARAHRHASAPWLRGYAHASTGLRRGLDVALSATSARPVGQAARGFVVELLAWHPDWNSDGRQRRSVDGMPRHITANSTAQGVWRTHGPPCGTGW
jgi:hypothetical protein